MPLPEEEKKVCPMKYNLPKDAPDSLDYYCEKELCAWWTKGASEERCAVKEIAVQLGRLTNK